MSKEYLTSCLCLGKCWINAQFSGKKSKWAELNLLKYCTEVRFGGSCSYTYATLYFYRWEYLTFTVTQLIYGFINKATITDRGHSADMLLNLHPQEKTFLYPFQIKGPLPLQWTKLLPFLTRLLLRNICRIHICGLLFSSFNNFNSYFIYYFDIEYRTKKSWVELLWEIKMHGPQLAWWTVVLLHSHSWAFIVFLFGAAATRATANGFIHYYWSGLALSLVSNWFEHFYTGPPLFPTSLTISQPHYPFQSFY